MRAPGNFSRPAFKDAKKTAHDARRKQPLAAEWPWYGKLPYPQATVSIPWVPGGWTVPTVRPLIQWNN